MSILFHEIQLDHLCGWRGQRWTKISQHHLIPEGTEDVPENRQFVPSHEPVELLTDPLTPHPEPVFHDGEDH